MKRLILVTALVVMSFAISNISEGRNFKLRSYADKVKTSVTNGVDLDGYEMCQATCQLNACNIVCNDASFPTAECYCDGGNASCNCN